MNTNKRFILCFISSLLVCLSFPNYFELTLFPKTAFLGWVALVPLFLALDGVGPRLGALLGWFFGFVQFSRIREMHFVTVKRKQRDACSEQKAETNQS